MVLLKGVSTEDALTRSRREMVAKQLMARNITDKRVLDAMADIPRQMFVPDEFRHQAYADTALPIGDGQTISQPYMVAVMTQLLELKGGEKVLEVGTGSGYQTAVLARLVGQVFTIERVEKLLFQARKTLDSLKFHNVALKVSDGTLGWNENAPYDAILVTAGGPEIPTTLVGQLKPGGKLVIPTGNEGRQVLKKIVKTPSGTRESSHDPCVFVKLIGKYGWSEDR